MVLPLFLDFLDVKKNVIIIAVRRLRPAVIFQPASSSSISAEASRLHNARINEMFVYTRWYHHRGLFNGAVFFDLSEEFGKSGRI